mgnify:FL=1
MSCNGECTVSITQKPHFGSSEINITSFNVYYEWICINIAGQMVYKAKRQGTHKILTIDNNRIFSGQLCHSSI